MKTRETDRQTDRVRQREWAIVTVVDCYRATVGIAPDRNC